MTCTNTPGTFEMQLHLIADLNLRIKVVMNVPLMKLLLQVVTLVISGIGILNWLIE